MRVQLEVLYPFDWFVKELGTRNVEQTNRRDGGANQPTARVSVICRAGTYLLQEGGSHGVVLVRRVVV